MSNPTAQTTGSAAMTRRRIVVIVAAAAVVVAALVALVTTQLLGTFAGGPDSARLASERSGAGSWVSKEFHYSVMFPTTPEVATAEQAIEGHTFPVTTFSSFVDDDRFVVAVAELPAIVLTEDQSKEALVQSLDGFVAAVGGQLMDTSFPHVDGKPAVSGVVYMGERTIHITITLYDGKQYSLMALSEDLTAAVTFLQSFSFTS